MNYLGIRIFHAARGVYLFPNFLVPKTQSTLIASTMSIWNTLYRIDTNEQAELFEGAEPFYLNDTKNTFTGLRRIEAAHEELLFNRHQNIPSFVKRNLIEAIYRLLVKEQSIPELQGSGEKLLKSEPYLNITVNFFEANSPKQREYTCGSLTGDKTALLIYTSGPSAFFHVPEKSAEEKKEDVSGLIPIPNNTLVVFTKQALKPKEQFLLPLFREKINSEQLNDHYDISKLTFSLRF